MKRIEGLYDPSRLEEVGLMEVNDRIEQIDALGGPRRSEDRAIYNEIRARVKQGMADWVETGGSGGDLGWWPVVLLGVGAVAWLGKVLLDTTSTGSAAFRVALWGGAAWVLYQFWATRDSLRRVEPAEE